ncbi:MAG: protein phosphatase CheZ, partial [Burkholderiales bacterium PBB5]
PDARERLDYVGQMTEAAANKALNMVDAAQPVCLSGAADAQEVASRMSSLAAQTDLSADQARAALAEAATTLQHLAGLAKSQCSVLSDIMMAQDFQDLSGQVIKKVVLIISHAEKQLLQLLAQSEGGVVSPVEVHKLEGPQVPDKAVGQADVDDLLASMGF